MFSVHKQRVILERASLAREVADRSVASTLSQLNADVVNLPPTELRGFVRAHAMPIVRDEATQLVSREWPVEAFVELVAAALDQTTHLVVAQLKLHPVVAVPAPHVRLRRAA